MPLELPTFISEENANFKLAVRKKKSHSSSQSSTILSTNSLFRSPASNETIREKKQNSCPHIIAHGSSNLTK